MDVINIPRMNDMHCHFRNDERLELVLPHTAKYANYGLAMPNTRPRAILTGADVRRYRDKINRVLYQMSKRPAFAPVMTIEIRDNTTPKMVHHAHEADAKAGKVYPLGVTTNSDKGLRDFFNDAILDTFRAMQDCGMLLLIHCEVGGERVLVTEREQNFLPTLRQLAGMFPDLKIVAEHVTSKAAIDCVKELGDNVAATITAHHLYLTLNDVIGDGIQPHNGCNPMPKHFDDRDALVEAATSGNDKFFLGSDSAPHMRENKECAKGACGVYTAPILPQLLAEVFERAGALDRMAHFTSHNGARFYGLEPFTFRSAKNAITLVKDPWCVPEAYDDIVPFRAGETLPWQRK